MTGFIIGIVSGVILGIIIAALCGASKTSDLSDDLIKYKHTCKLQQDKINHLRERNDILEGGK